jgi:hypothetical protein
MSNLNGAASRHRFGSELLPNEDLYGNGLDPRKSRLWRQGPQLVENIELVLRAGVPNGDPMTTTMRGKSGLWCGGRSLRVSTILC